MGFLLVPLSGLEPLQSGEPTPEVRVRGVQKQQRVKRVLEGQTKKPADFSWAFLGTPLKPTQTRTSAVRKRVLQRFSPFVGTSKQQQRSEGSSVGATGQTSVGKSQLISVGLFVGTSKRTRTSAVGGADSRGSSPRVAKQQRVKRVLEGQTKKAN